MVVVVVVLIVAGVCSGAGRPQFSTMPTNRLKTSRQFMDYYLGKLSEPLLFRWA